MRQITDPEVQLLAGIASTLRAEYDRGSLDWEGSPFAWIKTRPSRQMGAIGERLVAGWCAAKGLNVTRAKSSQADRTIEGLPTEIKFSTLWQSGVYKFQQFRDQEYEIAICLGISPFDAHCWVITKSVLLQYVIGHTPQHGGRAGRDTAWLSVDPDAPPSWLSDCGGRLAESYEIIRRIARAKRTGQIER